VPLPAKVDPWVMFEEDVPRAENLLDALESLESCDHYLLFGNSEGVSYSGADQLAVKPSSQYFRRRLAEHFMLDRDWNWRGFLDQEPDLITTIRAFEDLHVT
jgi:hypothetical protein